MSGCILHFGMHKTGSTSIQDSLHAALDDPRFHYVDMGSPNASAAIVTAFSRHPERQNMNRKLGLGRAELLQRAEALRQRLERELARARGRTALISGEHIPLLETVELTGFAEFVRRRCGELRAVGYVRDPAGYMESVFQQRVKGGRTGFDLEAAFPRYRARIGRLEEVLGAGSVACWRYEPAIFPHGCVVRDFCARLGIRFDPAAVRRSNEGLSLPALRLLYAYRTFGPGYGSGERAVHENFALVRLLAGLSGDKLRFDASLIAPVIAAHAAEIAWMDARLDRPLLQPGPIVRQGLRAEEDLLRFGTAEREWLARAVGEAVVEDECDARGIAAQMQRLRLRAPELAAASERKPVRGWLATLRRRLRRLLR